MSDITLTAGATVIELNEDLYWEDEDWSPVTQVVDMSVRGRPLIHVGLSQGGRPITLRPWSPSDGWITRSVLAQLRTLAAIPGQRMTLSIRGTSYLVIFRHQDRAIETDPVVYYSDPISADHVRATLRFMTVE